MKNELMMAGLLTLTAGMVSNVVAPTYAQASNRRTENKFPQAFGLTIEQPVRYTNTDGKVSVGHLTMNVFQEKITPGYPNLIKGEMRGNFFFVSDTKDHEYTNGEKTETWVYMGDDGDVMLDMVNQDKNGNRYQIYTCNSTMTDCSQENYYVDFIGNEAAFYLTFAQDSGFEILVPKKDEKGQVIGTEWSKSGYNLKTKMNVN